MNCPTCNKPLARAVSKSERNPNRPYYACKSRAHFKESFVWEDVALKKAVRPNESSFSFAASEEKTNPVGDDDSLGGIAETSGSPLAFLKKVETVNVPLKPARAWSKYQNEIFDFVDNADAGNAVVEAVAGCLAGETMIGVNRAGRSFQARLDHVVKMFNGGAASGRIWEKDITTFIRAPRADGTIRLARLIDAYASGEKNVYEVCVIGNKGERKVLATLSHRFLTPDGYVELSNLSAGSKVFIGVGKGPGRGVSPKKNYLSRHVPFHPRAVSKGHGILSVPTHILNIEASMNGMDLESFVWRLRSSAEGLTFIDPSLHVHHIDGNHQNNGIGNLKVVTREEHLELHKEDFAVNVQARLSEAEIKSIKFSDKRETYDLEIENAHAFMANDIAVHNSGKTTTLVEALNHTPDTAEVAFLAFNKHIATELSERAPSHVHVSTLHSLGYSNARKALGDTLKVDDHKLWDLLDNLDPYGDARDLKPSVIRLVELLKMTLREPNAASIDYLIDHYNIEVNGDKEKITELALKLFRNSVASKKTLDFNDMIYWNATGDIPTHLFDVVFVDELQDMSAAQLAMLTKSVKPNGRIVGVGDTSQCQPANTMVEMTGGFKRTIQQLKVGDEVVSYSRDESRFVGRMSQGRKIKKIAKQAYTGWMLTVCAGARQTQCTMNHKWVTRFTARTTDKFVVYLMKRGNWYRIGWCQLFDKQSNLHLGTRTRLEKAECAWIISVHDTRAEASVQESILSARYGIPTATFEPINGSEIYTRENLDKIFNELSGMMQHNAETLLRNFKRDEKYPFYKVNWNGRHGRTTIFVTEACNLIPELMSIPVYHGEKTANWYPVSISKKWVSDTEVYSLEVDTHETYVADGLLTHNSIYGFAGAGIDSMNQARDAFGGIELPLSISYRCPKSVVEMAQRLVPQIEYREDAPDGLIATIPQLSNMRAGDMVLCRTNAPLVKPCMDLIRNRVKATIRGRDIGNGLVAMLKRGEKRAVSNQLTAVFGYLEKYVAQESAKLIAAHKETRALALQDQFDTLVALSDGAYSVGQVIRAIGEVFSNDRAAVTFSSAHRAKGLEADRVFILKPELMPFAKAEKDWEMQQEKNLMYVAWTRSKDQLYFVSGE